MEIMVPPSKGPRYVLPHSVPPTLQHHLQPMPVLEAPGHSQARLGQSLMGSLLHFVLFAPFYYRTYTGLGKQTLGGHKQNLVHTRTQEKGAGTPQGTDPDLPMGVQESLAEQWVTSGLLQGWGH